MPHNLNLSFNYVEGESLIMALKDLAVSSGSACTSASLEPSYVLRALGRNDELAHSSIRFTFGRFTTEEEVDYAAAKVREAVTKLRELSPLWDMFKEGVDLSKVEWAGALTPKIQRGIPPWHTATRSSTTTKTRATSASSTPKTPTSAPAWSARRPAAT